MSEPPGNPMPLSPGMAKMNKTASGCMYWLMLTAMLGMLAGIALVALVLLL